ncbi:uncharacterized protein ACLA_019440 [Aspergillus clavatus NRRL 1]|uniref:Uncharacterized protein n=1 Tax=Aspergillus clavatus (strain ATCC 1007 / CBS 513.65 / DSM 816 / NCTC 3887 / NRRL 1 / QM 1276 / 107) TaxID=344612 RepID=A1CNL8_ASPCL|nr:uncharacterized protein ACLA_019440 [Aspergillus clavatus NRRL 1]EAW07239.1 hypothetical protein ACLA_019440 [Aspergillus clavatus NRRL 1]
MKESAAPCMCCIQKGVGSNQFDASGPMSITLDLWTSGNLDGSEETDGAGMLHSFGL